MEPWLSPLYADLRGLPPLLLQVGDHEILRDDTTRLVERARAAGAEARMSLWPGMFHVFQFFTPLIPEARAATGELAAFVRERVGYLGTGRGEIAVPLQSLLSR